MNEVDFVNWVNEYVMNDSYNTELLKKLWSIMENKLNWEQRNKIIKEPNKKERIIGGGGTPLGEGAP